MAPDRLRSLMPLFGGATNYVDALDAILASVEATEPTLDELVAWHRDQFANVSSRESIRRRLDYLADLGLLDDGGERWTVGREGERYLNGSVETLVEIMCRRNLGLRSLLYALSAGPMDIEAINEQQLTTHDALGWKPTNTGMAKQRVNWLRSLGLVQQVDSGYALTERGREFTTGAVADWADTGGTDRDFTAREYETTVQARSVDPEFRATVLSRYDGTCPVSGIDHPGLLDVAHVLPWSEHPEQRADLGNVLPLGKTHHAAFDRGLFTIDREYRLRVHPEFETGSELLQGTLVEQAGTPVSAELVKPDYLRQHNAGLKWMSD